MLFGAQVYLLASSMLTVTNGDKNSNPTATSLSLTYKSLCLTPCICGSLRHPLEAALSASAWFVPYHESKAGGPTHDAPLSLWFSTTGISVAFRFPVRLLYCANQKLEALPTKLSSQVQRSGVASNSSESTQDAFLSHISVFVFREGNLRAIGPDHFAMLADSLQYVDLSHNRIHFVSGDALNGLVKLQTIDLRFNRIQSLGDHALSRDAPVPFSKIGSEPGNVPVMRLRGNPLLCSCSLSRAIAFYVTVPQDDQLSCFANHSEVSISNGESDEVRYSISDRKSRQDIKKAMCSESLQGRDDFTLSNSEPPLATHEENHDDDSDTFDVHDKNLNKFAKMTTSDKHHPANAKFNGTSSRGCDEEQDKNHIHRITRKFGLDVPLLLTMSAWFIMIYLGLNRFIKANDEDLTFGYFRTLDVEPNKVTSSPQRTAELDR